jgi:hypothetical protein
LNILALISRWYDNPSTGFYFHIPG